jgi:hypothetical protein
VIRDSDLEEKINEGGLIRSILYQDCRTPSVSNLLRQLSSDGGDGFDVNEILCR